MNHLPFNFGTAHLLAQNIFSKLYLKTSDCPFSQMMPGASFQLLKPENLKFLLFLPGLYEFWFYTLMSGVLQLNFSIDFQDRGQVKLKCHCSLVKGEP